MREHKFIDPGHPLDPAPAAAGVKQRVRMRPNPLRCMTPAGASHPGIRAPSARAERAGLLGSEIVPPPDLVPTSRPWVHATARVDAARYLAAAERIAAGKLDVFALCNIDLDSPPRWNRDPKTGVEAPLTF